MKNNKKTIVIVGSILITIIVIVGSVVTITKINKDEVKTPMSPVVENVISEQEAERHEIDLTIYDQLINGIERPPEVQEVLETNEETGETLYVTSGGDVALVTKPEEVTRTDEEILADLDNIWYEVNGVSKDETQAGDKVNDKNQDVVDEEPSMNPNAGEVNNNLINDDNNDGYPDDLPDYLKESWDSQGKVMEGEGKVQNGPNDSDINWE